MHRWRALPLFLLLLTGAWCTSAFAQARYACRQANGAVTISDQPCGTTGSPLKYHAPSPAQQQRPSSYSRSPDAPEFLQYMSGHCSSMHEGMRTAGVRGVAGQTTAELQRNYQVQCADDEREARDKLALERREQGAAKLDAKNKAAQKAQRSALGQQQCDESKVVLFQKKKRSDLSAGEKADLARFEDNYRSRCGG